MKINYSGDVRYVIGDFWDIVARLKEHHARFRFRARRWRWPGDLLELEQAMRPYQVVESSLSEAQALQLVYDRETIQPTQEWVRTHARMAQVSVEWWEAVKFKNKHDSKNKKLFEAYRDRVALALQSLDLPPAELDRDQIFALQHTRRMVDKYESRIVKWLGERAKERRREEVLTRFEREGGFSREHLLEAELNRDASRQALYEEVAGLDWLPHEISELKAVAKHLIKEHRKDKNNTK